MVLERDYVLKRLDEWYSNLVKDKYTNAVAAGLKERLEARLEGTETLDILKSARMFEQFSPENYHSFVNDYFSRSLDSIESSVSLDQVIDPDGMYKNLVEGTQIYLKKIIESVRIKSEERFPQEISDEDMREAYLSAFEGLDNAIEFGRRLTCLAALDYERLLMEEKISEDQFYLLNELTGALSEEIPYLLKTFFGDKNE